MIRMEGDGLKVEIAYDLPLLWGLFNVKKKSAITGFYTARYEETQAADTAFELTCLFIKHELAEILLNNFRFWRAFCFGSTGSKPSISKTRVSMPRALHSTNEKRKGKQQCMRGM